MAPAGPAGPARRAGRDPTFDRGGWCGLVGVTGSSDAQQPARTLLLVGADMPVSEPTMGSSRFNVFFLFILVISPLLFLLGARGLNVVLRLYTA